MPPRTESSEPNIYVVDAELRGLRDIVHGIAVIQKEQQETVGDLLLACRMQQDNHTSLEKRVTTEIIPDVKKLMTQRSEIKGGWLTVLTLIGWGIAIYAALHHV